MFLQCQVLLLLFFFSLVFQCLLSYVYLLVIVMCVLDMLLIKAAYLLTYLFPHLDKDYDTRAQRSNRARF